MNICIELLQVRNQMKVKELFLQGQHHHPLKLLMKSMHRQVLPVTCLIITLHILCMHAACAQHLLPAVTL